MAITIKPPKVSGGSYSVSGDTLEDLSAAIASGGPQDPNDGGRYAGKCRAEGNAVPKENGIVKKKGDKFEAEMTIKNVEISFNCEITLPKLGQNKLSKDAKKEWDRFVGTVASHENGHLKACTADLKKFAKEYEKIKVKVVDKDKKKATDAAVKKLKADLKKLKSVKEVLTASVIAYDRKTGHGKTQGATLKTDIK